MKFLRKKAIKALQGRGFYQVKDLPPLDFRGYDLTPLQLAGSAGEQAVLVEVPVEKLRAFDFIGFDLARRGRHPFVMAGNQMLSGQSTGYSGSLLESYYEFVKPSSFSDVLFDQEGLKLAEGQFASLTSLEASFPWLKNDPGQVRRARLREMSKEARQHGLRGEEYLCWPFAGPVSRERGGLEYGRLQGIIESITREGYAPGAFEGHIGGYLLMRDDDEYAVVIAGGQHRVACLSALGYDRVPVLVKNDQNVSRRDSLSWRGVASGFFTKDQALNIFDRVLEGRLPDYFEKAWA
ncbi:hypothetical protein [Halomonas sp. BM-2019]|uniref:hypothetical protein n=1 Tax=Halomonas sp. BM-2019 TaxID=2811227 RepID=UPI001B3C1DCB|nr:MAG: hypothetical protein J5F18_12550 [Halomonas sp. BM-2019]